jgi:hypothetical protein
MGLSNSRRVSTAGLMDGMRFRWVHAAAIYQGYLQSCMRRQIDFDLPAEIFELLIFANCVYCGRPPVNESKWSSGIKIKYNGIDRVDNSLPYTQSNTVPCCKECNSMKGDRTMKAFLDHCRLVAEFRGLVSRPDPAIIL